MQLSLNYKLSFCFAWMLPGPSIIWCLIFCFPSFPLFHFSLLINVSAYESNMWFLWLIFIAFFKKCDFYLSGGKKTSTFLWLDRLLGVKSNNKKTLQKEVELNIYSTVDHKKDFKIKAVFFFHLFLQYGIDKGPS